MKTNNILMNKIIVNYYENKIQESGSSDEAFRNQLKVVLEIDYQMINNHYNGSLFNEII